MCNLDKPQLRRFSRSKLNSIDNKSALAKKACNQILLSPEFKNAKSILAYYPLDHELNSIYLLKQILASKKKLYLPFSQSHNIGQVTNLKNLSTDEIGLKVPKKVERSVPEIDLIILPGLAFDKFGYRLGYGSGWYDIFLSQLRLENIVLIGLTFDLLILEELPIKNHDIPVDILATESKFIEVAK
jgi:5-formyltetrahydrofolate cyclo-ligase